MSSIQEKVLKGEITPQEAVKAVQRQGRPGWALNTKDERRERYRQARKTRKRILKARVPFIVEDFLPNFYLAQGLIVVGAESGKSKSTTCANILAGFLKHAEEGKQAVVITNEEEPDAVLERTACIMQEVDYLRFMSGRCSNKEELSVLATVDEILGRVDVLSEDERWDMQYYEDVVSVLEGAATQNVGIVLIDYLQTVTMSRHDENVESFKISKKLGFFLKDYGKKNGVPVVTFVQLSPETGNSPTMAVRIQNDKTFYNHGFVCIEIIPDFQTLTTKFIVHKDRFCGQSGKWVVMRFVGGRHVLDGGGL